MPPVGGEEQKRYDHQWEKCQDLTSGGNKVQSGCKILQRQASFRAFEKKKKSNRV